MQRPSVSFLVKAEWLPLLDVGLVRRLLTGTGRAPASGLWCTSVPGPLLSALLGATAGLLGRAGVGLLFRGASTLLPSPWQVPPGAQGPHFSASLPALFWEQPP